jgi:hemerythrin
VAVGWDDKFNTGISSIDEQHKRLFFLSNQVFTALTKSEFEDNYDQIMAVLKELKEYTFYHLEYEEKILQQCGYADFDAHKQQHDHFIEKIRVAEEQDIDNNQKKVLLDLLDFLSNWTKKHIMESDQAYKELLLEKNIK